MTGADKEYKKIQSASWYNFRRSLGHLFTISSSALLLYGLIYPLVFGMRTDDDDDEFSLRDLVDANNPMRKHIPNWTMQGTAKRIALGLAAAAEGAT